MLTKYNSFPPFSFVAFTLFCIYGFDYLCFCPMKKAEKALEGEAMSMVLLDIT
jgi:hypothetical protein